jgi:hypothetical protein
MALTDEDKQWISQQLQRVETSLLTEFHKWTAPMQMRQRSHSGRIEGLGRGNGDLSSPPRSSTQ